MSAGPERRARKHWLEQRIVEHQPVGTLIVDRGTIVRFANPAAARMLVAPSSVW
jgi:PAS domain-containing protein